MHDVRMGKSFESHRVKQVVNNMVDSILRNRDALVILTGIKSFDESTFIHSLDVCILCLSLARHLNLSREDMIEMGIGALLHDVGKMSIPLSIIQKPGILNEEEWAEVRKHPIHSAKIMEEPEGLPSSSKEVALQHHERCDGSGYPLGLKGNEISFPAQICGIVDYYVAITANRHYQKGIQPHEAVRKIYERSHTEFKRSLVERFIQCIGIYPFGSLVLLDTEEMGIVCRNNADTLLRRQVLITYRDPRIPFPGPFHVDLNERWEKDDWFKRSIPMPLNPTQWNIRIDSYLSEILRYLG